MRIPNWLSSTAVVAMMFTQAALPLRAPARAPATASVQDATSQTAPSRAPSRANGFLRFAPAPQADVQSERAGGGAADANQAVAPRGKTIVIDAGHGGHDPGAVHKTADGQTDITEEDANLAVAQKLAAMLKADGYNVQLTRTSDTEVVPGGTTRADLQGRVDVANNAHADVFVSIHFNGLDNHDARGTEVWYSGSRSYADQNKKLAEDVQQSLVQNLRAAGYDTQDRGIKDDSIMGGFALLATHMDRPSQMPAIIGEPLFITNDQDAAALKQPKIQNALAQGYFQGIKTFLGDN